MRFSILALFLFMSSCAGSSSPWDATDYNHPYELAYRTLQPSDLLLPDFKSRFEIYSLVICSVEFTDLQVATLRDSLSWSKLLVECDYAPHEIESWWDGVYIDKDLTSLELHRENCLAELEMDDRIIVVRSDFPTTNASINGIAIYNVGGFSIAPELLLLRRQYLLAQRKPTYNVVFATSESQLLDAQRIAAGLPYVYLGTVNGLVDITTSMVADQTKED